MLKFKFHKLNQISASVLLPRISLRDSTYIKQKIYNRTSDHFSKIRKSTNSGNKNEGNEKQMSIIKKCFAENVFETESKISKEKNEEKENILSPKFYTMKQCEKCDTLISNLFENNKINNEEDIEAKKEGNILKDVKVQATTSKLEEEKLAQKVEIIDETPHVEAHAPKVEGFNAVPKVLGHEDTYEMSKLSSSNTHNNEHAKFDELAKRCLGLPIGEIDKIIVQELKNISENNSQRKLDMDLHKNQCVEQSFRGKSNKFPSHTFQSTPNFENKSRKLKAEKIQPIHFDTIPLLVVEESTKDFKVSSFGRELPTFYLTEDVGDFLLDVPATLTPYESPAIPFYEYINKKNIASDDNNKIETAAISETIQETDIIFDDEKLQRSSIDQERQVVPESGESLNPKPNINQFINSYLEMLSTYDNGSNVFNTHRLYMSNTDQPTSWQSENTSQKSEPQNSAISGHFLPLGDRRTLDLPLDTAISANQNPEEYYNMSIPEVFETEKQFIPIKRIFVENPVSQNMIFSALPQLELQKTSKETEGIPHKVLNSNLEETEDPARKTAVNETNLNDSENLRDTCSCSVNSSIPLSVLLKRIREQNRLEYCRNIISKTDIKLEGTKKFSCPPIEKSKSKTSVKPGPCQPKSKPASEPCKPSPCPGKKDPCAKLIPVFLSSMIKNDKFFDNALEFKQSPDVEIISLSSIITEDIVKRIHKLGRQFKNLCNHEKCCEVVYARDFDPWVPIPSWPIPKKEKDKPFVCPKEGCKIPLPRTNKPCKEKQCLPKKSFSFSEVF